MSHDSFIDRLKYQADVFVDLGIGGGGGGGAGVTQFNDTKFILYNDADNKKVARFDCSNLTSGVTRNFYFPDVPTSILLTDTATQNVTNKYISQSLVRYSTLVSNDADVTWTGNQYNNIRVNCDTKARNVYLPSVATWSGLFIKISKGTGTFPLYVQRNGSDTFEGASLTLTLWNQNDNVELFALGTALWGLKYSTKPYARSDSFFWMEFGSSRLRVTNNASEYRLQTATDYWFLNPVMIYADLAAPGEVKISADQTSTTDYINGDLNYITLNQPGESAVFFSNGDHSWTALSEKLFRNYLILPDSKRINITTTATDSMVLANQPITMTDKIITNSTLRKKMRYVTATLTVYYADEHYVKIDTTGLGSTVGLILPNPVLYGGLEYEVEYGGGTQILQIDSASGGGTINVNFTSYNLYYTGDRIKFLCDANGADWKIVSRRSFPIQINTATSITMHHANRIIYVNNAGAVIMTIPLSSLTPGLYFRFYKESGPANPLNITLTGPDTYQDGASTKQLLSPGGITIVSGGPLKNLYFDIFDGY